jgi:acyl-CoA dehydrogenase
VQAHEQEGRNVMDFELPEELRMLKDTLRRFVNKELIPIEGKSLTDKMLLKPEVRADLEAKVKDLGLWNYDVPEEYGGLGMGVLGTCVVVEEMGRTVALPPRGNRIFGPEVRPALYALEGDMKERYLLPVIRGERKACFAQTEPDAGSDPGGMRTTAVREGDVYVLNGTKHYINAGGADFGIVLAATDRSKGSRGGISAFIFEFDMPGVSRPTTYKVMTGETLYKIVFDNVRIPVGNIIRGEGQGFGVGQQSLGLARIKQGARALGATERALEMGSSYAQQRVTFGRPIADRQAIQWMLVDSWVDVNVARLLVYATAAKADQKIDVRTEAYMCKLFCTEMAFRAVDRCMQIHGGAGLMTDLPIERMWRDQRSHMIGEGTTEIMRMVLARKLFEHYR